MKTVHLLLYPNIRIQIFHFYAFWLFEIVTLPLFLSVAASTTFDLFSFISMDIIPFRFLRRHDEILTFQRQRCCFYLASLNLIFGKKKKSINNIVFAIHRMKIVMTLSVGHFMNSLV
jgi:hypothetical protein